MTKIPRPGADFKPAPAGNWPAVCSRIVDMGTQPTNYKGKAGTAHQVLITWELHGDETTENDGSPMIAQRAYTWSMSPKANLRKMLESWRGKAFEESDFDTFDIAKLLGAPCLINLTHSTSDGTTYANITTVAKLPKGMAAPTLSNGKVCVWLKSDLFDKAAFSDLSDKLQDKIKASPEYQELMGTDDEPGLGFNDNGPEDDDEVPF
jgi:hypothetical protein